MPIDERLQQATRQVKEYDRLRTRLETTRNMEISAEKHRDQIQHQLNSEKKDIERLDGNTLVNLWHTIKGTKEEVQRKEQEEYLAARLKYDEASRALESLNAEKINIEKKLMELGNPQEEHRKLLLEKENFLIKNGGPAAQRLLDLSDQLGKIEARETELREALEAGNRADIALAAVEKSLSNASDWGMVDILGGGLLTTAIKHSKINEARDRISQAQDLLQCFKKELNDVQLDINAGIGSFLGMADYFLDGLVVDIFVQSKINTALESSRQLHKNLQKLEEDLNMSLTQNQKLLQQVKTDKQRLLETFPCQ